MPEKRNPNFIFTSSEKVSPADPRLTDITPLVFSHSEKVAKSYISKKKF